MPDIDISRIEVEDVDITQDDRKIIDEVKDIIASGCQYQMLPFKKVSHRRLSEEARRVNKVIRHIKTNDISETNKLLNAASMWVARRLGLESSSRSKKQEPWWKRRIEGDIKSLRADISFLEREKRGDLKSKGKLKVLEDKYRIKRKGLVIVIEELKQRLIAKRAKLSRYEQRIAQYRQNRLFESDQKRFYKELNGDSEFVHAVPNAEESKNLWGDIWSVEKKHNVDAEWLREVKQEIKVNRQEGMIITEVMVSKHSKKMPNWKAPGEDGVQSYWIKRLDTMHGRISEQLNDISNGVRNLPEWMTYGRTVLCLKDPERGNAVDNYRPITCLPLMWKLLTGMIADNLYGYLEREKTLPDEQKGCRRESRGTKDQLLIDKAILKDCRKRHTNLAMAWIDYRKAYDMVHHSWISECLKMFGVAENVKKFLEDSMSKWKLELSSSGEILGDVQVRRGIFQGDSLSPLLFVVCMIPLTLILRKTKAGYEWGNKQFRVNHLMFMDDLKLFGKSNDQIDSLIQTVHLFSKDINMEFGLKKCGILVLKRGKIDKCDGVTLPDGQIMKEIEKNGYRYLGVVELDRVKEREMKEQFVKEYKRRLKLVLKSKLNGKNKIMEINIWAVAVFRYGAGIIKWTESELKDLDRKTRKMMTLHGAFHPKSDVDRLYVRRNRGGRGLISCEKCVKSEENNLGWYIKNADEVLLEGVKVADVIEFETCINKDDFKRAWENERIKKWHEKKCMGNLHVRSRKQLIVLRHGSG